MVAELRGICGGLGWLGAITIAAALAWWGILFPSVVANTGLSFGEALPCVASNSQLCELETTLCGARHLFGITSYSPTLFWCGAGLLSLSLLAGSILPQAKR
jgi:hypothetical protein